MQAVNTDADFLPRHASVPAMPWVFILDKELSEI